MVESRTASFTSRSIKAETKLAGHHMAVSMTDLTTLEGKDTAGKVRSLCCKAIAPGGGSPLPSNAKPLPHVAAICVYPELVEVAREALDRRREGGGEHANLVCRMAHTDELF